MVDDIFTQAVRKRDVYIGIEIVKHLQNYEKIKIDL
jgi:hypothetical protein